MNKKLHTYLRIYGICMIFIIVLWFFTSIAFPILLVTFLFITISFVFLLNPNDFLVRFFGTDKQKRTPAEIIKYVGILCGGVIVVISLYDSDRVISQTRKHQLESRFDVAVRLLEEDNDVFNANGINSLYLIYKETKDHQMGYEPVIKSLLTSSIRKNTFDRDTTIPFLTDSVPHDIAVSLSNRKPLLTQGIVDLFFNEENKDFFKDGITFQNCAFTGISFDNFLICNATFINCYFVSCVFRDGKIENSSFSFCEFSDGFMKNVEVRDLKMTNSRVKRTNFDTCMMERSLWEDTLFDLASFGIHSYFRNINFNRCRFKDSHFSFSLAYDMAFHSCKMETVFFTHILFRKSIFTSSPPRVTERPLPDYIEDGLFMQMDTVLFSLCCFENVDMENIQSGQPVYFEDCVQPSENLREALEGGTFGDLTKHKNYWFVDLIFRKASLRYLQKKVSYKVIYKDEL